MKQPKDTLKSYFETGDKPTEQEFCDVIDSYHHIDSGAVVTSTTTNSNGEQQVMFSNGTVLTIQGPVTINQNNKIKVVDLGVLTLGNPVLPLGLISINIEDQTVNGEDIVDFENPTVQEPTNEEVLTLLTQAVNNLNPPITINDDENVIFEFDIQNTVNNPGGPFTLPS